MEKIAQPERVRVLLNQIVRDKIFFSMIKLDQLPVPADGHEHPFNEHELFKSKLAIEMKEFHLAQTAENKAEEAADVLAVLDSYARDSIKEGYSIDLDFEEYLEGLREGTATLGIKWDEIKAKQAQKAKERGEFDGKFFVNVLNLRQDDPWRDYYESQPERFSLLF